MSDIWLPEDNKFVMELEVKIAACQAQIDRIEEEIAKTGSVSEDTKHGIYTLSKIVSFLRREAFVVSLSEFAKVMKEKASMVRQVKVNKARVGYLEAAAATLKKEIQDLEKQKENVKFKLIQLRGTDEES